MPTNKGALIRRQVIDRCLSGHRFYSVAEIMERCNAKLEEKGFRKVTSENTIRTDMFELEAQYPEAEIVQKRQGRNLSYHYRNPDFSIYHLPLTDAEIVGLTQALAVLNRFEGMPGQEWLHKMLERFSPVVSIDASVSRVVGFDTNTNLKGRGYFATLLQAIVQKQVLIVRYCSYNSSTEIKAIIHPYYLKQYNNRWFLFGWNEELKCLTNFAFDRILEITTIPKQYIPNTKFDFDKFFSEMVGVSRTVDDVPLPVTLWVSKQQLPYILSKPLHHSQQIIENCNDGAIIQIDLIPNFELEQQILSLAEHVKVLSPSTLRDRIKNRITSAQKNYE